MSAMSDLDLLSRSVRPSKREIRRWASDVRACLRALERDLDSGDMESAFESAQEVACSASELAELVFERRLRLRPSANPHRSEGPL